MIPLRIKEAALMGAANKTVNRVLKRLPKNMRYGLGIKSTAEVATEKGSKILGGAAQKGRYWVEDFFDTPAAVRRRIEQNRATVLQQKKAIEDVRALEVLYRNSYHPIDNTVAVSRYPNVQLDAILDAPMQT